jgi:hypothetical protein
MVKTFFANAYFYFYFYFFRKVKAIYAAKNAKCIH